MTHAPSRATRLVTVFALLPVLAFSFLCTGLSALGFLATAPVGFAAALTLATATTAAYAALLLWIDRHEREPWWMVLGAFGWGAGIATSLSLPFNLLATELGTALTGDPQLGKVLAASFSAPIVEESAKGVALLAILAFFRRELDDVLDGVVYGAMVGLGFAWWENVTYYMVALTEDGPVAMIGLGWARGVVHGVAGHATFTGLTGLGVGLARAARGRWWGWVTIAAGLGLAILSHFAWNTFASLWIGAYPDRADALLFGVPSAVVVFSGPFVALLAVTVLLSWHHTDAVLREHLAQEAPDLVPAGTLDRLVPARRRTWHGLTVLARGGPVAWWRDRQRAHALVELAYARWHHAHEPGVTWTVDEDPRVVRWRAAARRWAAASDA